MTAPRDPAKMTKLSRIVKRESRSSTPLAVEKQGSVGEVRIAAVALASLLGLGLWATTQTRDRIQAELYTESFAALSGAGLSTEGLAVVGRDVYLGDADDPEDSRSALRGVWGVHEVIVLPVTRRPRLRVDASGPVVRVSGALASTADTGRLNRAISATLPTEVPDWDLGPSVEPAAWESEIPALAALVDSIGGFVLDVTGDVASITGVQKGALADVRVLIAGIAPTLRFDPAPPTAQTVRELQQRADALLAEAPIRFDPVSDDLALGSQATLDDLARVMIDNFGVRAEIRVRGNPARDRGFEEALARRQTMRIAEYLVRRGVNADRLEAVGLAGTLKEPDPNSARDGRRARRVEILFLGGRSP